MIIGWRALQRLPVFTESGVKLGRVYDLKISTDGQALMEYEVRGSYFSRSSFLIKPTQVREITDQRIVVDDNAVKQSGEAVAASPVSAPRVLENAMTAKEN